MTHPQHDRECATPPGGFMAASSPCVTDGGGLASAEHESAPIAADGSGTVAGGLAQIRARIAAHLRRYPPQPAGSAFRGVEAPVTYGPEVTRG